MICVILEVGANFSNVPFSWIIMNSQKFRVPTMFSNVPFSFDDHDFPEFPGTREFSTFLLFPDIMIVWNVWVPANLSNVFIFPRYWWGAGKKRINYLFAPLRFVFFDFNFLGLWQFYFLLAFIQFPDFSKIPKYSQKLKNSPDFPHFHYLLEFQVLLPKLMWQLI